MTGTGRIGSFGDRTLSVGALVAGLLLVPGMTVAASPSPAVVASPSPIAQGMPHDVPALEALLPDAVDGTPLLKLSLGRPSIEAMGNISLGDLDALVEMLGIERTDLELAFANDPTADQVFNYFAWRAAGIPGDTLVETYAKAVPDSSTGAGAVVGSVTIDGRKVVWIAIPGNPVPNLWFWAQGDTLVGIHAVDQATFEKLYRLLPHPAGSPASSPGPSQPVGA
jgi:hypothetical protein